MSQGALVFITGGSSGIGQALASRYRALGWRVALVARGQETLDAWIRNQGWTAEQVRAYAADVRQPDGVIEAAQRCIAEWGVPDVVIANAGISVGMDTAVREDLEVMRETFETNNIGMAATFHPFLKSMLERRHGTLVGIASVAAIRGLPGHAAYCASKAGVVAYCESLRGECRPFGVRVVTLLPGYIATPLTASNNYRMPFLMQPEEFAVKAVSAIRAGVSYRVIPWQMGYIAKLLRGLPNACFDVLLAGRGRKKRRGVDSTTGSEG